jgi:hypothetical protein
MKVVVTKAELNRMVIADLERRGFKLKPDSAAVKTHTEGQWDEATEIFDGIEVELED